MDVPSESILQASLNRRYLVAQRIVSGGHYGKAMLVMGIAVNVALVVTASAEFAHFAENNKKS